MTPSQAPPRLAFWLLEHSGADSGIIGDIVEEYGNGRTTFWFWKQAVVAASPTGVRALRWLAVIPLAVVAVGLELWVRWLTGFLALPAAFIMAFTLVRVSTSVAPRQKDSVRRIALNVVIACGGLEAFMNQLLGFRFIPFLFWIGIFAVLGGIAGCSSAAKLRTILWREINIDWLCGLTRPPRHGLGTKDRGPIEKPV